MDDAMIQDSTPSRRSPEEDAELWERLAGKPGENTKASPVHRLKLASAAAEPFAYYPQLVIPPDDLRGAMILKGIWRIGTDRLVLPGGSSPWAASVPCRHYADRLHRFDWLPDLVFLSEQGAERARDLLDDWVENFGRFDGFSWRLGCAADRVWNWMRSGAAIFEVGEDAEIQQRLDVLNRQVRHIEALLDEEVEPTARWRSLCVLISSSICLSGAHGLEDWLERFEAECTAQFFLDGGHVSRSPARAIRCLADMISLRNLLRTAGHDVPGYLGQWIDRTGGMVTFFTSGDGALPPFHDSDETYEGLVSAVTSHLETPARRFSVAPKSGFQKLAKGQTWLILDAGAAPELPYGDRAHAGALSFELHDGIARLVTSCGWSAEVDLDFQEAVRHTSAHSTLMVDESDSCQFVRNDETSLLYPAGPEGISAKRLEEEDEIWLDAQHGGYKFDYGFLHRRRLFMSGDGRRLTGEDSLARPVSAGTAPGSDPIPFTIRFHLHPTVQARAEDGVFLLQSEYGPRWRFKTSHGDAALESTIYLGRGVVERSYQIVLTGAAEPNSDGSRPPNCVRWAFLKG